MTTFRIISWYMLYFLFISSDTVSFFLPFALRFASIFLPLAVDILSLKPCLFLFFLIDG